MPLHPTGSTPIGCLLFSFILPSYHYLGVGNADTMLSSCFVAWRTEKVEPLHVDMVTAMILTSLRDSVCAVSQRSNEDATLL